MLSSLPISQRLQKQLADMASFEATAALRVLKRLVLSHKQVSRSAWLNTRRSSLTQPRTQLPVVTERLPAIVQLLVSQINTTEQIKRNCRRWPLSLPAYLLIVSLLAVCAVVHQLTATLMELPKLLPEECVWRPHAVIKPLPAPVMHACTSCVQACISGLKDRDPAVVNNYWYVAAASCLG